jgi:hypothetical protein
VSALEKVTKYCSTNSKVGGKVFLELAMAYEAEGRTQEAVTVYTTLSKSRMEEIKFDAKRLLYGIEAMQFMRNEAKLESFEGKRFEIPLLIQRDWIIFHNTLMMFMKLLILICRLDFIDD